MNLLQLNFCKACITSYFVIQHYGRLMDIQIPSKFEQSLDEHYGNLGSKMWAYIKGQLEQNMSNYINNDSAVLQLPDDDVLTSQ